MAHIPNDRRYTKDHEWAKHKDDVVFVGITHHAVQQLGDVTLVELPGVGTHIKAGERFGDVESVKTVSELFAPISGEVVSVNERVVNDPELVNRDPYEEGWFIGVRPEGSNHELLEAPDYERHLEVEEAKA